MVCLDEMGPEAAKSWRGQRVVVAAPAEEPTLQPAGRAQQEIDYGRREKGYIFGAFHPATGDAFTAPYTRRTIANWVDFLEQVDAWLPVEPARVYAILDNLSTHHAVDVLFFLLTPAHAPTLGVRLSAHLRGLPEPDRTLVEDLALAGAQRPSLRNLGRDLPGGEPSNRLLERPQTSLCLGATPTASPASPTRHCASPISRINFADAPLRDTIILCG